MGVKRGDIVPVVQAGAYGKPRPALVVQSDLFAEHPSVVVLHITSQLRDAPLFRLRVQPTEANGLRTVSEVMIDKITTLPRAKVHPTFGQLEPDMVKQAERLLALFVGLG